MITEAQLAHWRKLADDTPPDWNAPLKDLGAIPSFRAVDFYFDNSYEVYPPLGYCGPLLVASSKEVAEFATAARTAVPALLDEVQALRARVTELEAEHEIRVSAELQRDQLRHDLESALALGSQAQARAQAAEAENARLREALEFYATDKNWNHTPIVIDGYVMTSSRSRSPECWIDAGKIARSALAASAPETGEREAVTEALLQWAASPEEDWLYWDFEEQKYFCAFCGNTNLHYREVIHTDSCLHLRAKALRAQAGVEGAG